MEQLDALKVAEIGDMCSTAHVGVYTCDDSEGKTSPEPLKKFS